MNITAKRNPSFNADKKKYTILINLKITAL